MRRLRLYYFVLLLAFLAGLFGLVLAEVEDRLTPRGFAFAAVALAAVLFVSLVWLFRRMRVVAGQSAGGAGGDVWLDLQARIRTLRRIRFLKILAVILFLSLISGVGAQHVVPPVAIVAGCAVDLMLLCAVLFAIRRLRKSLE